MIESIGLAAAQFALEYAGGRWLEWRKRQRLASAYRQSAEETINLCEQEGYPGRSPVWDSVVSLIGNERRARQVARWYTRQPSSKDLQDVIGDDPTVGHFFEEFIKRLNDRCAGLLPTDLAILEDIISRRLALLGQQVQGKAPQQVIRTTYWLGRPPTLGENFIGREAELDDLTTVFENCRVAVISGGAGTGKSRLAAEYSHQSKKEEGFWTTAGTTLIQTLVALAPHLGVPLSEGSDAEVAEQAQRRLSQLTQERQDTLLWVVDNVGDLNLVNELSAAAGSLRLLVTTRDRRRQLLPQTLLLWNSSLWISILLLPCSTLGGRTGVWIPKTLS